MCLYNRMVLWQVVKNSFDFILLQSVGYLMFEMKIGSVIMSATLAFLVFSYCTHVISEMVGVTAY